MQPPPDWPDPREPVLPANFEAVRPPIDDPGALSEYRNAFTDFTSSGRIAVGDTIPPSLMPIIYDVAWPGEYLLDMLAPVAWPTVAPNNNSRPAYGAGITPTWEDWHTSLLCGSHEWWFLAPLLPNEKCPSLPATTEYCDINIVNSVLNFSAHQTGSYHDLTWQEAVVEETGPPAGALQLKVNVSYGSLHTYGNAQIYLKDSNGKYRALYFVYGSGYSSNQYNSLIGFNAGEPFTVDLTALGFSGRIIEIKIRLRNFASTIAVHFDYFTLTE